MTEFEGFRSGLPEDEVPRTCGPDQAVVQSEASWIEALQRHHLLHLKELAELRAALEDLARQLEATFDAVGSQNLALNQQLARQQTDLDLAESSNRQLSEEFNSTIDRLTSSVLGLQQEIRHCEQVNCKLSAELAAIHVELSQRIQSIEGSRIWRALVWIGGVLLRLTGRGAEWKSDSGV